MATFFQINSAFIFKNVLIRTIMIIALIHIKILLFISKYHGPSEQMQYKCFPLSHLAFLKFFKSL